MDLLRRSLWKWCANRHNQCHPPGYTGTKMVMAIPKDVLDTKIIPRYPWGDSVGPKR